LHLFPSTTGTLDCHEAQSIPKRESARVFLFMLATVLSSVLLVALGGHAKPKICLHDIVLPEHVAGDLAQYVGASYLADIGESVDIQLILQNKGDPLDETSKVDLDIVVRLVDYRRDEKYGWNGVDTLKAMEAGKHVIDEHHASLHLIPQEIRRLNAGGFLVYRYIGYQIPKRLLNPQLIFTDVIQVEIIGPAVLVSSDITDRLREKTLCVKPSPEQCVNVAVFALLTALSELGGVGALVADQGELILAVNSYSTALERGDTYEAGRQFARVLMLVPETLFDTVVAGVISTVLELPLAASDLSYVLAYLIAAGEAFWETSVEHAMKIWSELGVSNLILAFNMGLLGDLTNSIELGIVTTSTVWDFVQAGCFSASEALAKGLVSSANIHAGFERGIVDLAWVSKNGFAVVQPDPTEWLDEPKADSAYFIRMSATPAEAWPEGDIQYYFEETTGNGNSSGWQTNPSYVDIPASCGVKCCYRVRARREGSPNSLTLWSDLACVELSGSYEPSGPSVRARCGSVICSENGGTVTISWVPTGSSSVASTYQYEWVLRRDGRVIWESPWSPQAQRVFEGLQDAAYEFCVRPRDAAGKTADQDCCMFAVACEETEKPPPNEDNEPPRPNPMSLACDPTVQGDSITVTAVAAEDESGVEYYFEETTGNGHSSGWQRQREYADKGVPPDTTCCYRVKARDRSPQRNETDWSAKLCVSTAPAGLDAPTGVKATDGQENAVTVTWNEVPGADGYEVYRSADEVGPGPGDCISGCSGQITSLSYQDASGNPDQEYFYAVRARKGTQWSDFSEVDSGFFVLGPPPAPYGLSVTFGQAAGGDDSFLHWSFSGKIESVEYFEVAIYDGSWHIPFLCGKVRDPYLHECRWQMACYGFVPGQTRWYKVRAAFKDGSVGNWSEVLKIRIPDTL